MDTSSYACLCVLALQIPSCDDSGKNPLAICACLSLLLLVCVHVFVRHATEFMIFLVIHKRYSYF